MVKNLPANAGDARDAGSIPGRKIPWRRAWQPTLVFLPGGFHGQRTLLGYSQWDHRESAESRRVTHTDTQTHRHTDTHTQTHTHTHTPPSITALPYGTDSLMVMAFGTFLVQTQGHTDPSLEPQGPGKASMLWVHRSLGPAYPSEPQFPEI